MGIELYIGRRPSEPTYTLTCDDCDEHCSGPSIAHIHQMGGDQWHAAWYDITGDSGYRIHVRDGGDDIHVQCPACVDRDWEKFN